ncbi:MAG: TolC family protein [Myxococcales bacterium]|nr:TolC family protein [Myxococcales bacterium]
MLLLLSSIAAHADEALTLDAALVEAQRANARLPPAAFDTEIGRARLREARARRWATLSLEGDLRYAPRGASYNGAQTANEERLQLVARQPLYAGGALRAGVAVADAQLAAAVARYRIAEKDLDLEVRTRFSELLAATNEVRFRETGVERLRAYLMGIRERKAAGQGVAADVLKTEVRLENEEANIADVERRLDQARLELNDLLGRDPGASLTIAPLPRPPPPTAADGQPWAVVPELHVAEADLRSAAASVGVTGAEWRPHIDIMADAGFWGSGFTDDPMGLGFAGRLRNDAGASVTLSFSWAFFDFGIYRARLRQARLALDQAHANQLVAFRLARLASRRAAADRSDLFAELQARARAVPTARDSYLESESLYRGGAGTALEVLDAYTQWIDTQAAYEDALLRYRVAEATALRWGTP